MSSICFTDLGGKLKSQTPPICIKIYRHFHFVHCAEFMRISQQKSMRKSFTKCKHF